jgi:general secretion pathway protein K
LSISKGRFAAGGEKIFVRQLQEQNSERIRERGVALIAALWTVVLLAIIATALIAVFRSDARILQIQTAQYQASEAAKAAIDLAIVALSDPHGDWPTDGTTKQLRLGDAEIDIRVTREAGKVDLNTSNPDLLRGILDASGTGPGLADELTRAIIDRRSATDALGRRHPMESIGELTEFPQISRDVYLRLVPNLTLYSKSSTVDLKSALPDVILSIPGNTAADVEAAERSRQDDTALHGQTSDLSRIIGQSFSITATARLHAGTVARRANVVLLTGNPKDPVWVLAGE